MNRAPRTSTLAVVAGLLCSPPRLLAQNSPAAPPPGQNPATGPPALALPAPVSPKAWYISASVGLATTSGNKDTSTFNAGYQVIFDRSLRNIVKSDGLFLYGHTNGEVTADRLGLSGRHEFKLRDSMFVFEQIQYVRDQFKDIDYLVAPTSGLGVRVVDNDVTKFTIDLGVGGAWEKHQSNVLQKTGAVSYGEKLTHQLSKNATITESVAALHKTDDFGDALFTLNASVGAALTARTQVKVEVLDTYKTRIPAVAIVKNDVALLVALVYKN